MTKKIDTIADLTPDGENFNKHTEFGQKLLEDSLRKFGAGRSILVDKDGNIIAGNSTTETAAAIGMEDVIVVPTDGKKLVVVQRTDLKLDSKEGRELALADNMTALKGIDLDLAKVQETLGDDLAKAWGMDIPEVQRQAQEDDFDPDNPVETVCKKGDIWKLGNHRLICGDSTDAGSVAMLMDGKKADLLLTDPPYNVQYVGKTKEELTIENDRFESDADFHVFITTALSNAKDHLKEGAAFYIWTAQGHAMYDVTKAADDAGLHFRQQLIWHKNHFVMGRMDYHGKHEPCLYGWKDGAGHYFTSDRTQTTVYEDVVEIDKLKKEEMRKMLHDILDTKEPTTILNCERPIASHEHPTMKPIKLMGMCITNSSRKGESVLDLFGGSGSTLIAAEQLNRKCYMMELDPHYCDVIIARWEKLTGNKAERISNGNE